MIDDEQHDLHCGRRRRLLFSSTPSSSSRRFWNAKKLALGVFFFLEKRNLLCDWWLDFFCSEDLVHSSDTGTQLEKDRYTDERWRQSQARRGCAVFTSSIGMEYVCITMSGSDPWPHSVLTRTRSSCSAFCSLSSPSPPKWILSGLLFSHWPSMCFCARISIRCFSSSHARVCNKFFSPVLIKPYARVLTLPNVVNCNSSGNKGNLGAPNLPGQGCSFHSFRTNTYKLSFMESPSGIKVWQSSWFVQTLSLCLSTSCFYVGCPGTEVHILCNSCCQFLHPSSLGFNSHHWHLDYELVARHLWWNSLSIIATLTWTLSLSHTPCLLVWMQNALPLGLCSWYWLQIPEWEIFETLSSISTATFMLSMWWRTRCTLPVSHSSENLVYHRHLKRLLLVVVHSANSDCFNCSGMLSLHGYHWCQHKLCLPFESSWHGPKSKGWLSFEHTKQLLSVIIIVSYLTCSFIQLNPALSLIVMKPWNWWTNCACLIAKLDVGFSWNWQVWAFQCHPRSVCEDLAVVWELLQQMTNLGGCLSNNWSGSHQETTHSFHLIFWDSWKSAQIHLLDGLIFVYSSLFSVMLQQWDVDSCRCCHGFLYKTTRNLGFSDWHHFSTWRTFIFQGLLLTEAKRCQGKEFE